MVLHVLFVSTIFYIVSKHLLITFKQKKGLEVEGLSHRQRQFTTSPSFQVRFRCLFEFLVLILLLQIPSRRLLGYLSQERLHSNAASKLGSSTWLGSTSRARYWLCVSLSTVIALCYSPFRSESQLVQQSIAKYAEKSVKTPPIPPVTKSGIQEHLLVIITTCDLVSLHWVYVHICVVFANSF